MKKIIFTLGTLILLGSGIIAQSNTDRDKSFELKFPDLWGGVIFKVGEFRNTKILVLSDEKILVYGGLHNSLDTEISGVLRLNADGSWDTTFDAPDFSQDYYIKVRAAKELPDGKYLIAGEFYDHSGGDNQMSIIRLNNDGSHDKTFDAGFNSKTFSPTIVAMDVQADGKILIGGNYQSVDHGRFITRLNTDGTVDPDFKSEELGRQVYDIRVLSNGKILIIGGNNGLSVLNADGSIDADLELSGLIASHTAVQTDGKIVVAGTHKNVIKVLRYNADYTLDNTFHVANSTANSGNYVTGLALQKDGKIIVTGYFMSEYDGNTDISGVMRLNTDGTVDTTFNTNKGFGKAPLVYHCAIQKDGKILLVTENSSYQGENLRATQVGWTITANQFIIRLFGDVDNTETSVKQIEFHPLVYPIPASETLHVHNISQNAVIRLINANGKMVHQQIAKNNFEIVDISAFTNGVYLLQIVNEGYQTNQKLLINR